MNPFLKWTGGKRQLLPELVKYVPEKFSTYYEPFVGGGAFFFRLSPERAILGDINDELVNTYRVVRDRPEDLVYALNLHAQAHSKGAFYEMRERPLGNSETIMRAARTIYLNKTCFNGLYRVNKSGKFNVPFGDYKNPKICDAENIRACSQALQMAVIVNEDFELAIETAVKGDFAYFDPPYLPISKTSNFTAYDKAGFKRADHERLRDCALGLKRRGVHVLLSNSSSPVVEELYGKDFELIPVQAKRAVNSKGSGRSPVKEWIIR